MVLRQVHGNLSEVLKGRGFNTSVLCVARRGKHARQFVYTEPSVGAMPVGQSKRKTL
jgi:hypothetical protein